MRANLELDRARRTRDRLERSGALLDQAERLARVGSWEIDVATGPLTAPTSSLRQLGVTAEDILDQGLEATIDRGVHPDDAAAVAEALAAAAAGAPLDLELRLRAPDGERAHLSCARRGRSRRGRPAGRLRGSNQDITDQRAAEQALAAVAGEREAAEREHAHRRRAAAQPAARSRRSSPTTSRSRPTTSPASRAPRSAATGTT